MRNKAGTMLMVLGAVLVLAALSLFLWNQREAKRAAVAVEEILPQLVEQIEPDEEVSGSSPETVQVADNDYIGYLSIPALGLELPVMSEWDYDRLKLSPCRYAGSVDTGDLVIAAHNYIRHFGGLKRLSTGDAVYLTTADGRVLSYVVVNIEILAPSAIEEMTAGEYALTLFTCTYGGQSRVTVRCNRAAD